MNLMSAKCRQLGGLPIWGRRLRLKFGREGGNGAEGQTRTVDTGIFSAVLYHLSYLGERPSS